ncbi:hypothetical protein D3C75_878020 [compost metagenome]
MGANGGQCRQKVEDSDDNGGNRDASNRSALRILKFFRQMGYGFPADEAPEENGCRLPDTGPAVRHKWREMYTFHPRQCCCEGEDQYGNNGDYDSDLYFASYLHADPVRDQSDGQHACSNRNSCTVTPAKGCRHITRSGQSRHRPADRNGHQKEPADQAPGFRAEGQSNEIRHPACVRVFGGEQSHGQRQGQNKQGHEPPGQQGSRAGHFRRQTGNDQHPRSKYGADVQGNRLRHPDITLK